jgi:hypothetical protein
VKPANAVPLRIVPMTIAEAKRVVAQMHRHHPPPQGALWAVGVADLLGMVRGVAVAGRPVARGLDDGSTLEITRVATDGTTNACSMLYGAVLRAAKALGWETVVTYTLASEPGTSLRASGWSEDGSVRGRSWSWSGRQRHDKHPTVDKRRWVKRLGLRKDTP